ncbi:MAG: DUF4347 domain-containing protein, partial [Ferrovibrio sp.]|nr:DUF4347 domain-containing protein [Ferrovibrio sp.]
MRPKKNSSKRHHLEAVYQPLTLRALEPRILFDAAAPAAVTDATQNQSQNEPAQQSQDQQQAEVAALIASLTQNEDAVGEAQQASAAETGELVAPPQTALEAIENSPKTVVFIDAKVEGAQALAADLGPSVLVRFIGADEDGIQAITDTLAGLQNVRAVHILGHGDDGAIALGSAVLNLAALQQSTADMVTQWGQALAAGGDLLLYGCSVAASPDGTAFVQELARLTGADVAASTNDTGAALRGGDWVLEYSTGSIEASVPFSDEALTTFNGLLADENPPTVNSSATAGQIFIINEATELTVTQFTVSDSDSTSVNITVTATNGTISLATTSGLSGLTGNGTGSVTFSGSVADVNAALNGMKYKGTEGSGATDDYTGAATITVQAADANGNSSKTINVNITPVNDVPVLVNNGATVQEGGELTFSTANFTTVDPDNQAVQIIYKVEVLPTHGTLTLNGNPVVVGTVFDQTKIGQLKYIHDGSQVPSDIVDSFSVSIEDGAGGILGKAGGTPSTPIPINITITPLNQAPTVEGSTDVYEGETGKAVTITIGDVDIGDGPHSIEILSLPTEGVLKYNGVAVTIGQIIMSDQLSLLTYDASEDEPTGPKTFDVRVTDNGGGEGAGAKLSVDATITLKILLNNDDPVLQTNQHAVIDDGAGRELLITNTLLRVTDVDSGDENITFTLVTVPSGGQVQIFDGSDWKYLVVGGTFTQDDINNNLVRFFDTGSTARTESFQFTVKDGGIRAWPDTRNGGIYDDASQSAPLTVITFQIDVPFRAGGPGGGALDFVAANQAPSSITANTVTLDEGATVTITNTDLITIDADSTPEQLVYRIENVSSNGTLYRNGVALGLFDSFTQADVNNGLITYEHNGSENFVTTSNRVQFTVSDGKNVSSLVNMDFDITPVNDQPTATVLKVPVVNEGGNTLIDNSVLTLADVDGSGDKAGTETFSTANNLTFKVVALPSHGTLMLDADNNGSFETTVTTSTVITKAQLDAGNLRYVHDGSENFTDSFQIQVDDNKGQGNSLSDPYTVNVKAAPLNDPPVAVERKDMVLIEGGTGTIKGSNGTAGDDFRLVYEDPDSTTIQRQYLITTNVAYGTLKLNGATLGLGSVFTQDDLDNNRVTYTHNGSENFADTFNFTVRDGAGGSVDGSYDITITKVNDAPTLTVPGTQTFATTTPLVFSAANNNAIVVDDPDYNDPGFVLGSADDYLSVTLDLQVSGATYAAATLTLASTSGLAVTGNGTATVTFSGTRADVRTALDGLQLQVPTDEDRTLQLVVTVNDQISTGPNVNNGGDDPASADAGYNFVTKTININASNVNDAPALTAPATVTAVEDTALELNADNGYLISIADADSFGSSLSVTLSVNHGTLKLGTTSNITISAGANESATMTITGNRTALNAALASLSYTASADFNATGAGAFNSQAVDTLTVTVNDNGNTGTGGAQTDSKTVNITVTPVNDAPTITVPGATQYILTAQALEFNTGNGNAISFSDAKDTPYELSTETYRLTLVATNTVGNAAFGTLTLGSVTGVTFVSSTSNGSSTIVVEGTLADLNAALQTLSYAPPGGNPDATVNIAATIDDLANGGTGALTDTKNITVILSESNDAPGVTKPAPQEVNEDTNLTFSTGNGNAVVVTDSDDFGGSLTVTLSVSHGTLTLSGLTGLTFGTGDGTADASMTFTGSKTAINNALQGLIYRGNLNYNGADTLSITVNDNGNSGAGGAQQTTDTVAITVHPVNDTPTVTVPSAQTTNEDTPIAFDATKLISFADVDDGESGGTNSMTVILSVSHGTLNLSSLTGLTIAAGASDSSTITLIGTKAALNAAITSLVYTPTANYNGNDTLTVVLRDDGNTGIDPGLTGTAVYEQDSKTVAITVSPINDRPTITVPTAQTIDEDTTLTFSGGTLITLADVDDAGGIVRVTLSVDHGTLALASTTGVTVTAGANNSGTMTLTGTKADLNAAINGLVYTPTANYNGSDTLTVVFNDQGNTGADPGTSGGASDEERTSTVAITVNPINDRPTITVPGVQNIGENSTLTFSGAKLITLADVDDAGGIVRVTLSVDHGTLALAGTTGVTVTAGANNSGTMTLTGTKADLNAAINGLAYTPTTSYNGADTLTIVFNDQGNTGADPGTSGGASDEERTATVSINMGPINDQPTITAPGAQTIDEDSTLTFTGGTLITLADIDDEGGVLRLVLSVDHGTLSLGSTTGLTFTAGGNNSGSMTLTGTKADLNAAIAGMVYTPTANYNGSDTLTVVFNDQGNTGADPGISGGASDEESTATVAITINPIDDAPVITAPSALTLNSGGVQLFTGTTAISVSDVDVGSGNMTLSLSVTEGSLMLTDPALITSGGNNTNNIVLTGTLSQINTALAGLSYTITKPAGGTSLLTIVSNDLGNTGAGGPLSTTALVQFSVPSLDTPPPSTTTPTPPPVVVVTPPPTLPPVELTNTALNQPNAVSNNNTGNSSGTSSTYATGDSQLGGAPLTVSSFVQSFFSLPINPVELAATLQDRVLGEQQSETFQIPASAFRHSDPSE